MNPQGSRMGHERLVLDVAQLKLDLSALVAGAPAGCVPARGWPGAPRVRRSYTVMFVHKRGTNGCYAVATYDVNSKFLIYRIISGQTGSLMEKKRSHARAKDATHVSVSLPKEILDALDKMADSQDRNRSNMIQRLIRIELEQQGYLSKEKKPA